MRERILALLAQGRTYNQIVAELGCAKSTVAYHARNVKPPPTYKVHDWAAVQAFYDEGHGVNACRRRFGICAAVWYNAVKSAKIVPREDYRIPLDELLVQGRSTARVHLKARLIQAGLLVERCARCDITHWLGEKLSLHLHHINGAKADNRLGNLQLLCPNCHSLTENYSGRNVKQATE
jgi:hypothetical protein